MSRQDALTPAKLTLLTKGASKTSEDFLSLNGKTSRNHKIYNAITKDVAAAKAGSKYQVGSIRSKVANADGTPGMDYTKIVVNQVFNGDVVGRTYSTEASSGLLFSKEGELGQKKITIPVAGGDGPFAGYKKMDVSTKGNEITKVELR
jgi:hypothetical protein